MNPFAYYAAHQHSLDINKTSATSWFWGTAADLRAPRHDFVPCECGAFNVTATVHVHDSMGGCHRSDYCVWAQ